MSHRRRLGFSCAAGFIVLSGCADGGVNARGEVVFRMLRADPASRVQVSAPGLGALASVGDIGPDTVQSLTVTIDSIQALRRGASGDSIDAGWVTVTLPTAVSIDLMMLPTDGSSPVTVAAGTLDAGDYANVRLFVSDAAIVFKGPLSVGAAFTFSGSARYDVTTPSAGETGIKTDAAFTVPADAAVDLLFDPDASFQNVAVTGNGKVMLAPVVRAKP